MARTYTVHGHLKRRDGRQEAFWTRTGLSKSAAQKLAREQRAEAGGVARVVAEASHATKKPAQKAQKEKHLHFAGYDFTSGPEGTVIHRPAAAAPTGAAFKSGDRVQYRDVNLWEQGTVTGSDGKWVTVRWDGKSFESREWAPNLRHVSTGAGHARKKTSAQLQREIDEVLAKPKTHYRSAVSGRYVQKDSARRRPRTTIKESHATKRGGHATRKLDDFTKAYLEAALWSSTDDNGTPLDKNYDIDNFAPEAIAAAVKDATTFQSKNRIDLVKASKMAKKSEYSGDAQHGHDFWLTRNGLGVGFWDRGYGDVGERLSDASRTYGSVDLYVGDDGSLYFS